MAGRPLASRIGVSTPRFAGPSFIHGRNRKGKRHMPTDQGAVESLDAKSFQGIRVYALSSALERRYLVKGARLGQAMDQAVQSGVLVPSGIGVVRRAGSQTPLPTRSS